MKTKTMISALLLTLCTSVSAMAAPSGTVTCPSASTIQGATYLSLQNIFGINLVMYTLPSNNPSANVQMVAIMVPNLITRSQARDILNSATAPWSTTATPDGGDTYHCNYKPGDQHITLQGNSIVWLTAPAGSDYQSSVIAAALRR